MCAACLLPVDYFWRPDVWSCYLKVLPSCAQKCRTLNLPSGYWRSPGWGEADCIVIGSLTILPWLWNSVWVIHTWVWLTLSVLSDYFVFFFNYFFPFIFISWRLITLQYLPYIDMNQPWIYMCSHPDPPSRLPPHPIPLGPPSAPALVTCLMHPTWAGDFTLDSILVSMLFSRNIPHRSFSKKHLAEALCFERWGRVGLSWYRFGPDFCEAHFDTSKSPLNPKIDYFLLVGYGHCGFCQCPAAALPDTWGRRCLHGHFLNCTAALLLPSCPLCLSLSVGGQRGGGALGSVQTGLTHSSGSSVNTCELPHMSGSHLGD